MRATTDRGPGAPANILRAIAVSAGVGAVVFAVLFLPDLLDGRVLAFRDIANYHLPVSTVVTEEWRAGRVPHWNPWLACGTPLAANPNNYALYPGRILDVMFGPEFGMQLHLLGHWFAGGIAAGVLAALLGVSLMGVAAVTLSWLVAGPLLSLLSFANLAPFQLWIPLTAIALVTLARRPGPGSAAALALALAVQATFAEPALLMVEMLFLGAVLAAGATPAIGDRRAALGWLGMAIGVAALLAAPAWVPTLGLVAESARAADRGADIATSVPVRALAQVAIPLLTGEYHTFAKSAYWGEIFQAGRGPFFPSIALGTAVLALAAGGLVSLGRRGLALLAAAVLGIVLSTGIHAPGLDSLLYSDAGRWFRWPVKLTLLPALALPLAAGAGVQALRDGRRAAALAAAAAGLALAGLALGFAQWFAGSDLPGELATWRPPKDVPRIVEEVTRRCATSAAAGAAIAGIAVAAARVRSGARGVAALLAILLVAAEMLPVQRFVNRGTPSEVFASDPPILAEARAVAATGRRVHFPISHWEVRLAPRPGTPDEWAPYFRLNRELGSFYHPIGERVPMVLINPDRLVSRAASARAEVFGRFAPADRRDFLRHLAVGAEVRIALDALASGARLHPTGAGWPAALVSDPAAPGIVTWRSEPPPAFERWGRDAVRDLAAGPAPHAPARAVSPAPGRWEVESDEPIAGWIAVTETRAPGWTARVDGAPAPILPFLDDFLAVAVPAGSHRVVLTWRPPGWRGLVAAAFLGLIAVGTLATLAIRFPRVPRVAGRARRVFPVSSAAVDCRARENP